LENGQKKRKTNNGIYAIILHILIDAPIPLDFGAQMPSQLLTISASCQENEDSSKTQQTQASIHYMKL